MRRTQMLLSAGGTLYARYKFVTYNKKGRKTGTYEIEGNDTTSNIQRNINTMMRNSFKDARVQLYYKIGGSGDYDAKLIDYFFIYREKKANGMKGKTHSTGYYEKQNPDITTQKERKDRYITAMEERQKHEKTRESTSIKRKSVQTRVKPKYTRAEQKQRSSYK